MFDPDDESLLHGGDMPARIAALCTGAGQPAPAGDGELLRSILVSLACKYRLVIEQLEQVSATPASTPSTSSAAAPATSCCAGSRPTSAAARS